MWLFLNQIIIIIVIIVIIMTLFMLLGSSESAYGKQDTCSNEHGVCPMPL